MITFQFLDWFWLILFALLMVYFGAYFYRLGKRSQSDFFLAGRGLPWWLPASSVYATHTATDTPIWVAGVVYKYGLTGLWYAFFSAWCAVSAFISTRIFRRSLAYSQAEWQSLRFGGLGSELLRGWLAGWQVFMNMFILGWVGIAMGKLCNMIFGWDLWIGLIVFTTIGAIYVLASGYWGVVMADFQQGIIALLIIIIVSVWGVLAAGGPQEIFNRLNSYNSTAEWKTPNINTSAIIRIKDPDSGNILVKSRKFLISENISDEKIHNDELKIHNIIKTKNSDNELKILFPNNNDILRSNYGYKIVWASGRTGDHVNIDYSIDNEKS